MTPLAPRWYPRQTLPACLPLLLLALQPFATPTTRAATWSDALKPEIERIDRESPGSLGVYVKRLKGGETFSFGADKSWYLGSTVKVPIAIATLQQVDAGKLRLSDRITLKDTDKIEAGTIVWNNTGTTFTIDQLLNRMLGISDNTAANMLIRAVDEDTFNASAKAAMGGDDYHRITTLAQVRYDVYTEIHPDAKKLTNAQLVTIAAAPQGPQRVANVQRALGLPASALRAKTIDEAYDRYYAKQLNSETLVAYGAMLEKLVTGQLLSPASTQRLYKDMKIDIFTNYRLQAGLPRSVKFIHKTGTQYRRACHSGVINPQAGAEGAIVVATCAADLDDQKEAGKVFERVGRAITATVLADPVVAASLPKARATAALR